MLYILCGTDTARAREKLHSLLDSLFKKKPDASFFHIDDEQFEERQLEELISGQGLFERLKFLATLVSWVVLLWL